MVDNYAKTDFNLAMTLIQSFELKKEKWTYKIHEHYQLEKENESTPKITLKRLLYFLLVISFQFNAEI